MEIERQAAVALKWHTASKVLGQTFAWAVTLIVLRLLAPEDYGLMAISAVIISIIAGTAEFGLGSALIQSHTLDRQQTARIAGALGVLNIGCGLLLFLAAPLLAAAFSEPELTWVIRVSTLQFVLFALEVVPQSLMQREMNFKGNAGIEMASAITGSATTLVLALMHMGVWALVIGNLAGGVARTVLLLSFGTFVLPSFRLGGIGEHIRFGGQMTAARFLWQLTYQMDTLIAARFLSGSAVGLYSVAMHLATLPINKAMAIVNQVAFPAAARLQHELERLNSRLLEALRLLAFVSIPVLWGLCAVAREFVDVVLGEGWREAILPLALVSFVAPARMVMAVFGTAVSAIGRADIELRNMVISSLILPVGFIVGVKWGVNGLAGSWLIAIPLILIFNLRRTCNALGMSIRAMLFATRAPLAAGVVMIAAVSAARLGLEGLSEAARLPLLIVVGMVAYLAMVQLLDRGIWIDARRLISALRS